jgi:hypothetical protein
MQGVKDSSGLYEVERRAYHAVRPDFRIAELQISPAQQVPWHYHNNVHETGCPFVPPLEWPLEWDEDSQPGSPGLLPQTRVDRPF